MPALSTKTGFKEHGVMMYLSKDLYRGWIKLQADKDLGRAYAALLPFTEGLYRLGYIPQEVYEENITKYSQSLTPSKTEQKTNEQNQLVEVEKQLTGMLEQWDLHNLQWQLKTIAYAKKHSNLEPAKKIIAKESESEVLPQTEEVP